MNTNFECYRVFCQVATHHSMTLAAQALNITQPAVSKSILRLEKALGCVLFHRTKSGVQLTAEGQVLYRYASHACSLLLRGEDRVRNMRLLGSGSLCVGTSDMLMQFFLLPYLQKFHRLYPNIRIRLITGNSPKTIAALQEGRIDLGIVSSPLKKEGLKAVPLCSIHDIFVAGESFSALRGKVISLQELMHFPLICCSPGTTTRQFLDTFFLQHHLLLHPEFELEATDMIVPFAESGLGIGIVLSTLAEHSLRKGRLFEIHTNESLPARRICVVTMQDTQLSCAAQSFLDGLTAENLLPQQISSPSQDYQTNS
ncbi:MAG: LysR family transcriptional regulator [Oscillospiraceae bacterium]|nr:LysR family transcriptional regulator [Oscillospiraceae bacterium]